MKEVDIGEIPRKSRHSSIILTLLDVNSFIVVYVIISACTPVFSRTFLAKTNRPKKTAPIIHKQVVVVSDTPETGALQCLYIYQLPTPRGPVQCKSTRLVSTFRKKNINQESCGNAQTYGRRTFEFNRKHTFVDVRNRL